MPACQCHRTLTHMAATRYGLWAPIADRVSSGGGSDAVAADCNATTAGAAAPAGAGALIGQGLDTTTAVR